MTGNLQGATKMSQHLQCDKAVTTAYFTMEFHPVTQLTLLHNSADFLLHITEHFIVYSYLKWHKSKVKVQCLQFNGLNLCWY